MVALMTWILLGIMLSVVSSPSEFSVLTTLLQLLARVNPNALARPSAEATMLQPLHSAAHANWMIAAIAHDPRAATVSAAHAALVGCARAVLCVRQCLWLEVVCKPSALRCPERAQHS